MQTRINSCTVRLNRNIKKTTPLIAGNSRKRQSAAKLLKKVQRPVYMTYTQVSGNGELLTDNAEDEDMV